MILDRQQFADWWNELDAGRKTVTVGNLDHPLWIPEQRPEASGSKWFVCIKNVIPPGKHYSDNHKKYWNWCNNTMKGQVLCYSSSEEKEWWGFTEYDDIPIWLLRWSR